MKNAIALSLLLLFLNVPGLAQRADYDRYYAALDLMFRGQYLGALSGLDSTTLNPDDLEELHLFRGICYTQLGENDAALASLSRIPEQSDRAADAQINAAIALYNSRAIDSASTLLDQLIRQNTHADHALNLKGNIAYDRAQYSAAIGFYDRATRLPPGLWTAWCNLGNTYYRIEQYDSAAYCHEHAATLNPDAQQNLLGLARTYSRSGKTQESIRISRGMIARDSLAWRAYAEIGYALMTLPGYDRNEAAFYLQRAIELEPASTWYAYRYLGDLYAARGLRAEALRHYDRSIELNPGQAETYIARGDVYRDSALYGPAISDYMMAQDINPNGANPNLALGEVMSRMNDAGASQEYFDRYIQLSRDKIIAYRNVNNILATRSLETGAYDEAIRFADQALSRTPDDAVALSNRGFALAREGKADSALLDLNRAAGIAPGYAGVYHNRAYAYARKGNYALACNDLKRALSLDPNYRIDSVLSGMSAQKCGQSLAYAPQDEATAVKKALALVRETRLPPDAASLAALRRRHDLSPVSEPVYDIRVNAIEQVYPNPATEDFMITLKGRLPRTVSLTVPATAGLSGRQYAIDQQRTNFTVSCRDWSAGTYTLLLISGNKQVGHAKIRVNR